jgi:hypothetical protein
MRAGPPRRYAVAALSTFRDALESQVPPERVGELRLRFEDSLLWLEPARVRHPGPELLGVVAVVGGVMTVAALVTGGSLWLALFGACVAAAGTAGAVILRGRVRAPTRFVLDFAGESLRLDGPGRTGRRAVASVPFDAVTDLRVVESAPRRFGLALDYKEADGTPKTVLVMQHARPEEIETLRRVWRILRNAFGIRPSAG